MTGPRQLNLNLNLNKVWDLQVFAIQFMFFSGVMGSLLHSQLLRFVLWQEVEHGRLGNGGGLDPGGGDRQH